MNSIPLKDILRVAYNSKSLHKGEVSISSNHIKDKINLANCESSIRNFNIRLQKQHVLIEGDIGKAGIQYSWKNSFALRSANLNKEKKYMSFELSPKAIVKASSFGAKAIRYSPNLISIGIPGVAPIIGSIGKCIIDNLAENIVRSKVQSHLDEQGFSFGEDRQCTFVFPEETFNNHPVFTPVRIPRIGNGSLFGDVIVVRRVKLEENQVKVQLGLNPLIAQIAQRLYPDGIGNRVGRLALAGGDSVRNALVEATEFDAKDIFPNQEDFLKLVPDAREWASSLKDLRQSTVTDSPEDKEIPPDTDESSSIFSSMTEKFPQDVNFFRDPDPDSVSDEEEVPEEKEVSSSETNFQNKDVKGGDESKGLFGTMSRYLPSSQEKDPGEIEGSLPANREINQQDENKKSNKLSKGDLLGDNSKNKGDRESEKRSILSLRSNSLSESNIDRICRGVEKSKERVAKSFRREGKYEELYKFKIFHFQEALTSEKQDAAEAYKADQPEEVIDIEWAEHLETMDLLSPDELVDGLDGFDVVDFIIKGVTHLS